VPGFVTLLLLHHIGRARTSLLLQPNDIHRISLQDFVWSFSKTSKRTEEDAESVLTWDKTFDAADRRTQLSSLHPNFNEKIY
jgi:hypothetical protein